MFKRFLSKKHQAAHWLILWAILGCFNLVFAQPVPTPMGKTVLDNEHPNYQFRVLSFANNSGLSDYRVFIGIPKTPAPKAGFPVFYAVDGNAALSSLTHNDLSVLAKNPQVLVFIGYDSQFRFDFATRAFDFTPPVSDKVSSDALETNRKNGGADQFFALIEQQIMPAVENLVDINRHEQTLWGHSYGGLFVLYSLYTKPIIFQHYIASDPSLWWREAAILKWAETFSPNVDNRPFVRYLKSGNNKSRQQSKTNDKNQQARLEKRQQLYNAIPKNASNALIKQLNNAGIITEFNVYPTLSHGQLFNVSLQRSLNLR